MLWGSPINRNCASARVYHPTRPVVKRPGRIEIYKVRRELLRADDSAPCNPLNIKIQTRCVL
jgi:hypothetical protein